MRSTRPVLAVLLFAACPAFAEDVPSGPEPAPAGTAEGAQALRDDLAPYLGQGAFENGTVKVEPDPAGYRVTIDPKPLAEALKAGNGGDLAMTPYSLVVSRRENGDWNYFSDAAIDFTMRAVAAGVEQTVEYDIGEQRAKGVYSPVLAAILSGTSTAGGASMTMRQPDGDVTARFGAMRFDLTGRSAGDGMVDMALKQSIEGFSETIVTKQGADAPPGGMRFDIRSGSYDGGAEIAAARSRPILDLYAFFVRNPEYLAPTPDRAKLAATQAELKQRIAAALPLWNGVKGAYTLTGLEAGSQLGGIKAERMRLALDMTGIAAPAALGYEFGIAGLEVLSPLLPAWTAALLPHEMELRFRFDGIDLRAPADLLLADFDLARAEIVSAEVQKRIGESFLADPLRFVIGPSRIVARDYDLALSGSVVVQNDRPALTLDVSAGGIDKAIGTLQEAARATPDLNQAVGVLAMAKGFGKTLPDGRTQWIVDASSDGSVKVNGFQVKAPDPVGAPDGDVPPDEAPTDDNALPDAPPR